MQSVLKKYSYLKHLKSTGDEKHRGILTPGEFNISKFKKKTIWSTSVGEYYTGDPFMTMNNSMNISTKCDPF